MDILPACRDDAFGDTCIRVPDRELADWSPSNPKGYVKWFQDRSFSMRRVLMEKAAELVPAQQDADDKLPLQLAVQLIKRWRDLYYPDDELAPISVVLTTLAGWTYRGESSPGLAVSGILDRIVTAIEGAELRGERIVVKNPSNELEDLSERWTGNPEAYVAFTTGIRNFRQAWQRTLNGVRETNRFLEHLFGEPVQRALVKQARILQEARKASKLAISSAGMITVTSPSVVPIRSNTFHGEA